MKFFGVVLCASFILTSCGGNSKKTEYNSAKEIQKEIHTCATCGASFDWACTTDVFGKCVCGQGCSGR
jgi:hypothetical protein